MTEDLLGEMNLNDPKVNHFTNYRERHPLPPNPTPKKTFANLTSKKKLFLTSNQCTKSEIPSKLWQISSKKDERVKNILKVKLHYQKGEKKTTNFFFSSSGNEWKL